MAEIERKALALVNAARGGRPYTIDEVKREYGWCFQAVCIAIGRDEAFRQEVSDACKKWTKENVNCREPHDLDRFIIAKPDHIRSAALDIGVSWGPNDSDSFRAALAARGLKIVWEDKQ